jgi:ABC-type glycerol-3-phosphate transport system substrate-binding protein
LPGTKLAKRFLENTIRNSIPAPSISATGSIGNKAPSPDLQRGNTLKKKYSLIAVAIAAAVAGTTVVAMPAQAAKPKITIWVDAPRLPGAKLYAQLMKNTVDVKVELKAQGELVQKVSLFNRVKKGWPDVVFGPPNDVSVLRDAANARALNDLAPASFWKDMEAGNQWCKGSDGKYYCVKNDLAQTVLWVNTKLMKDFGYTVPKTMADFEKIGLDIAKNHPGYSVGALGAQGAYSSFLWPSQCPVNQATSATAVKIAPKSPKCTRATTLLNNLVTAGVMSTSAPWDADFIKDFGAANKVVMTIGPSWFGEFVIRPAGSWNVPAGQITAAPMPMWAGEKINYSGEWGGGIYTVSPHSKFPKEALAFAIFMVSDKRNVVDVKNPDGSKGAPTFPASQKGNAFWKAKVSSDKYYAADPYPAMLEQSKKIFSGEKPVSYDTNSAMEGVFSNELKKSKNAQTALEAFATYATNLAKQLGYKVATS